MFTKNALGNLRSRYRAVLKKCHLLNTFGTLAIASLCAMSTLGFASSANAYTPTLETTSTSTAYTVEEITDSSKEYYTTFTQQEKQADDTYKSVIYGVLIKANSNISATGEILQSTNNRTIYGTGTGESTDYSDITGDFIGNTLVTDSSNAYGGALYFKTVKDADDNSVTKTVNSITGNFIGNSITSTFAMGSAISIQGTNIGTITGDFIGNSITSTSTGAFGALYNTSEIGSITGDFINNSATAENTLMSASNGFARGGAIYNAGDIGTITGNFIGNSVQNSTSVTNAAGGAIYHTGTNEITSITGDFIENSATSAGASAGGAIYNMGGYTASTGASNYIGDITGNFIGNSVSSTGSGSATGGAIANVSSTAGYAGEIGNITGSFIGNYAESARGTALGGAIYTTGSLNFTNANNETSYFTDNYTLSGDEKEFNAIYVDGKDQGLVFEINNGGFVFNDSVTGSNLYEIKISG